MQILYFGCGASHAGHYLWEREWSSAGRNQVRDCLFYAIDGSFFLSDAKECEFLLSTVPPWTIISWKDNSVDSRLGSHSTFLFKGFESQNEAELLLKAMEIFPRVFGRQRALLVPAKTPIK